MMYGMTEITRNFYDMTTLMNIPKYGLNMVNGYETSIGVFEKKLMLCAEVSHRILHKDTIYDIICRNYDRSPDSFKAVTSQYIVGQILMTQYGSSK